MLCMMSSTTRCGLEQSLLALLPGQTESEMPPVKATGTGTGMGMGMGQGKWR